jgi:hypothetical protein
MILDLESTLRTVFTIYAAVWIGVVAILFIATGLLLKRAETLRRKHQPPPGDHH